MKEIQDILRHVAIAQAENLSCALATVVRVSGSTYRRPGARMLISSDGRVTGTVSGGCLEKDVFDQARRVLSSGQPRLLVFDTTADDEATLGFGLGCGGTVEVLVECLAYDADQITVLRECLSDRSAAVLATVFAVEGAAHVNISNRFTMRWNGAIKTDIRDEALREAMANDAKDVLQANSRIAQYEWGESKASVYFEHIEPPTGIMIFGVGHDCVPVVNLAKALGWHITLVDHRPGNIQLARSLGVNVVIVCRGDEIGRLVQIDTRSVAVVMNHNYLDDLAVLASIMKSALRYVGVLGPRLRTQRLLNDLRKRGVSWTTEEIGRLYAPAGLDIGAEHPEEIALAIMAEIQTAISQRSAESLRDKSGPLHPQTYEDCTTIRIPQIEAIGGFNAATYSG